MKLARFDRGEGPERGIVTDDAIAPVESWSAEGLRSAGAAVSLESVTLLAPVEPRKIIGIGRNYADHARELGNEVPDSPLMFLKPGTSVIGPGAPIVLPAISSRVDYEGELAIVIGERARRVSSRDWRTVVLGFCCGNDVTARDIQKKDIQFTRGKGFDTFCPLGPWIETDLDVEDLELTTRVNGTVVQSGRTSSMIFDPGVLIEKVTEVMTLEPGDVILTGTPEGVGALVRGDRVEVEIEGVGVLDNVVA